MAEATSLLIDLLVNSIADKVIAAIRESTPSPQPQNEKSKNTLYTKQQVADMFDVTLATVGNWMKAGKITAHRTGNRVYFTQGSVEKALKEVNLEIRKSRG